MHDTYGECGIVLHFSFSGALAISTAISPTSNSTDLGRVELGSGGTGGKTLSTGEDSLVTELFPVIVSEALLSEWKGNFPGPTQFGGAGCTLSSRQRLHL